MKNPERCSCGAREKNKCNKESTPIDGVRYGKMCVKELKEESRNKSVVPLNDEDKLFINFRDTLNGGFCADIDYGSQAWQKVLSDWSEFKIEENTRGLSELQITN